MSNVSAEVLTSHASKSQRRIALLRAGAAGLWAVLFFLALHGRHVLSHSGLPAWLGVLIVAYPAIDLVSSVVQRRLEPGRGPGVATVLDGAAIVALLIAATSFHTMAVLIAFGSWALVSGLLMLPTAWRSHRARVQLLPLVLSGTLSTLAGITLVAMASRHVAPLSNLGGYALLGAVLFVVWSTINRLSPADR